MALSVAQFVLAVAQFVLGFCLSLAVAIIAGLQWHLARNKLRLDLFDRRYQVYEATRAFLRDSIRYTDSAQLQNTLSVFNDKTSNAEFLFDTDVVNYLEDIRKRVKDQAEGAFLWLSKPERITEMTKIFNRYLGFQNVRI